MHEENHIKTLNKNLDWGSKKAICELWKKTPGISMSAFCRQQGISVASFSRWHKILWPKSENLLENKKTKSSNWLPIKITEQENKQDINVTRDMELLLPNKITVKINIEIKEMFNFIKELLCHK